MLGYRLKIHVRHSGCSALYRNPFVLVVYTAGGGIVAHKLKMEPIRNLSRPTFVPNEIDKAYFSTYLARACRVFVDHGCLGVAKDQPGRRRSCGDHVGQAYAPGGGSAATDPFRIRKPCQPSLPRPSHFCTLTLPLSFIVRLSFTSASQSLTWIYLRTYQTHSLWTVYCFDIPRVSPFF